MKFKKISLVTILVFSVFTIQAQLSSIINSNKKYYSLFSHFSGGEKTSTEVIGFGDDTTLNGTAYKTVLRATDGIENPIYHYGYMREKNNKIFYKDSINNPEKKFYDFTINPDDTIEVSGLVLQGKNKVIQDYTYLCDSIYTETISGINRQIFSLHNTNNPEDTLQWIEGIGSKYGLLHNESGDKQSYQYELTCVKQFDTLIYDNPDIGGCMPIALQDKQISTIKTQKLMISPNPATNFIRITNVGDRSPYKIYNVTGKLVKSGRLNNERTISISRLPEGVYFLRIKSNKVYFEKLIKK